MPGRCELRASAVLRSARAPADLLGDSAEKQGVCVGAGQFSVFAGGVQAEQRAVGGLFFVGCFTGDLP